MGAVGTTAVNFARFANGLEATVGHLDGALASIAEGDAFGAMTGLATAGNRLESTLHSGAMTTPLGGRALAKDALGLIDGAGAEAGHSILLQVTGAGPQSLDHVAAQVFQARDTLAGVDFLERPLADLANAVGHGG